MNDIYEYYLNTLGGFKVPRKNKTPNPEINMSIFNNCEYLKTHYYSLSSLKNICTQYGLKKSGINKELLCKQLYIYMYLSARIVKIQRHIRLLFYWKYKKYKGPAYINRSLCTNASDFVTLEAVEDIPDDEFFSFKDDKNGGTNIIYGCACMSFQNLIFNTDGILNPYTRMPISSRIIRKFRRLMRMGDLLKIQQIPVPVDNRLGKLVGVNDKITNMFDRINNYGNYADPNWLRLLDYRQLVGLMLKLLDLWDHRLNLSDHVKRCICPPRGFLTNKANKIPARYMNCSHEEFMSFVVEILEKLVYTGISDEYRTLGAYYVLGSIVLVNPNAAESIPYLYIAFS